MFDALNTATLERLRDKLLAAGDRETVFDAGDSQSHPLADDAEARATFDAVAEAMFLMVAADGKVDDTERTALRGALLELTGHYLSDSAAEKMIAEFGEKLAQDGSEARLEQVCGHLKTQPNAAEAAFVLAAAIAFADAEIAREENELINTLAENLGISAERAETLLDELEATDDLNRRSAAEFSLLNPRLTPVGPQASPAWEKC